MGPSSRGVPEATEEERVSKRTSSCGIDLSVPIAADEREDIRRRLLSRIVVTAAGCWEFQGSPGNPLGHRKMSVHNRPIWAHKLAFAVFKGPIPKGTVVRHSCDNPPCIRDEHLVSGTQLENIHDALARGRAKKPPVHRGLAHHMATLTEAQIEAIRARWAANPTDQRALAREYGVSQSTIWRLVHRKTRSVAA